MREIRQSGSEGGGAGNSTGSPYPYIKFSPPWGALWGAFQGALWRRAFFGVAAWAAFGPGPRDCSVTLPFFQGLAADWLCRGAFSFGALFLGVLLVVLIRRLLRGQTVG